MKELVKQNTVYLEEYDVNVHTYLSYAQIQQIIDGVMALKQDGADTWAERQTNIDVCILYHATDITMEEIEKYGHAVMLESGLIDAVKSHIINLNDIDKGLSYTESTYRAVGIVLKEIAKNINTNEIKDLIKQVKKAK